MGHVGVDCIKVESVERRNVGTIAGNAGDREQFVFGAVSVIKFGPRLRQARPRQRVVAVEIDGLL